MFNIDFEDQKVKSFFRTVQYTVLTVLAVTGTIILVFAGRGYDIDRNTGQVIQNGLVLVESIPDGAVVVIDGQPENDTTPSRLSVPGGEYGFKIDFEGYRSWEKQIIVSGSAVEWLAYPLLIPESLKTTHVSAFKDLEFVSQNPNTEKYLVRTVQKDPIFKLISIKNGLLVDEQNLSLPTGLITLGDGKLGSFDLVDWIDDGRYALITHTSRPSVEYILLDTENVTQSRNITSDFDLNLTDVVFINQKSDQLYTIVDGDLRKLNLADNTISAPIAKKVASFTTLEDKLLAYIRTSDEGSATIELALGANSPVILSELTGKAAQYKLDLSELDGVVYLTVLDTQNGRVIIFVDPHKPKTDTKETDRLTLALDGAKYLTLSDKHRFITIQSSSAFVVYDFEESEIYRFKLPIDIPTDSQVKWMDNYRMLIHDKSGLLYLFEFDGANLQPLVKSNQDFPVMFENSYKYMYTQAPSRPGESIFFESTKLIID
jgi:hypothetical protein